MQQDTSAESDESENKLQKLRCSNPIMLFMRGTHVKPGCGFSKIIVYILREEHVKFGTFDILTDEIVQNGLNKLCNDNSAFPHLYCNGKMLGGPEMIIQMHHSGQLRQIFLENGIHFVRADADSTVDAVNPTSVSLPVGEKQGLLILGGLIFSGLFFLALGNFGLGHAVGNVAREFKTIGCEAGNVAREFKTIGCEAGNVAREFKTVACEAGKFRKEAGKFRKEALQEFRRSSDKWEDAFQRGIDITYHPLKGIHIGAQARK